MTLEMLDQYTLLYDLVLISGCKNDVQSDLGDK